MKTKLLTIAAGLFIGFGTTAQITPTPQLTERGGWAVIDSSTVVEALKLTKYTEGMTLEVQNWQGDIYGGTAWDDNGTEFIMKYDGSKLTNVQTTPYNWSNIVVRFQTWEDPAVGYQEHGAYNRERKFYSYMDPDFVGKKVFAKNPQTMKGISVDFSNPKNAYITFEYKLEASQPKVPIMINLVDALDRQTLASDVYVSGELATTSEWKTATVAWDPQATGFDLTTIEPAKLDADGKLLLYDRMRFSWHGTMGCPHGNYPCAEAELAVERICGIFFAIFPNQTGLTETATFTIKNIQMGVGNYDFITLTKTGNGTITGNGGYERGSSVTVTAIANSDSEFIGWEENGTTVSTDKNYTFVVNGDRILKAVFQLLPYITIQKTPFDIGNIAGNTGYYERGESVTFTAIATMDSKFVAWQENGTTVSTDAAYTFEVTGDRTLTAVFERTNPIVTVSANSVGAGIVCGSGTYFVNELAEVTAMAYIGYKFVNWQENGVIVSYNARYLFRVSQSRNLVATFQEAEIPDINIPEGEGLVVIPDKVSAQVAWKAVENAAGYKLIINDSNNEIICSLEFDSFGRLIGLDFGSGLRSQNSMFGVRITNLSENTTYNYTMDVLDKNDEVFNTKAGTFTTKNSTTATLTVEKTDLEVYPNPTKGQITINASTDSTTKNTSVAVYNSIGIVVGTFVCTSDNNTIDISHLPSGVYFVQINGQRVKVVKQ